jgi:hypothetical protein
MTAISLLRAIVAQWDEVADSISRDIFTDAPECAEQVTRADAEKDKMHDLITKLETEFQLGERNEAAL